MMHKQQFNQLYRRLLFSLRKSVNYLALGTVITLAAVSYLYATPPDYRSFARTQNLAPIDLNMDRLLRIWVLNVGQGDALLIQLPEGYRDKPQRNERIEILIDGGNYSTDEAPLLKALRALYVNGTTLEYAVLSHHDADHVRGLIAVLNAADFGIETIFHNGLASYTQGTHLFENDGTVIEQNLISNLISLQKAYDKQNFHGLYAALADAVMNARPIPVNRFDRAYDGMDGFIQITPPVALPGEKTVNIKFELVWPGERIEQYGDWSHTINGNSVVFRMIYGKFSMLFTGDINKVAQESLLATIGSQANARLDCDVLKLPHHGSADSSKVFLQRDGFHPVLSVASMGSLGFRSKQLQSGAFEHPSPQVIQWVGGAHRTYSTYIHERRFTYDDWAKLADRDDMLEKQDGNDKTIGTHIGIETDGQWFRLVETADPTYVLSVQETRRGNGTRWIAAE
ncbi:MAG: MBL fold metallo-hydrolase [Candidatus Thiodiazotropha sp.]|jgi:beta-lactamase superfamily II metal-dependent hydrolase